MAGALDVRLGGRNVYGDRVEERPTLGDGRPPVRGDIRRAVRLSRTVWTAAAALAALSPPCRTAAPSPPGAPRRGPSRSVSPVSASQRRPDPLRATPAR